MSLALRAWLFLGPNMDFPAFEVVGSTSASQRNSIHKSVEDAFESESAFAGVGFAEQFACQKFGFSEMLCALRKVDVAALGKLRDVLMSFLRKKVSEMVARAVLGLRFSQSVIYLGVDMVTETEKVSSGGSVCKWIRIPPDTFQSRTQWIVCREDTVWEFWDVPIARSHVGFGQP